MEDVVDLPFPGEGESDSKGRDDSFHLKGAMVLVVQLPRGSARFDVASVEHHQVSDLVLQDLSALGVRVVTHSFVCCF